jgi:hypothetical protein
VSYCWGLFDGHFGFLVGRTRNQNPRTEKKFKIHNEKEGKEKEEGKKKKGTEKDNFRIGRGKKYSGAEIRHRRC